MPDDAKLDHFASPTATESEADDDPELGESETEESDLDESEEEGSGVNEPEVGESEVEESEAADSEVEDPETDESAGERSASDDSTVEPARSTYAWSPEGGECADCGASVERRWRADGQRDGDLVCADCKDW